MGKVGFQHTVGKNSDENIVCTVSPKTMKKKKAVSITLSSSVMHSSTLGSMWNTVEKVYRI